MRRSRTYAGFRRLNLQTSNTLIVPGVNQDPRSFHVIGMFQGQYGRCRADPFPGFDYQSFMMDLKILGHTIAFDYKQNTQ